MDELTVALSSLQVERQKWTEENEALLKKISHLTNHIRALEAKVSMLEETLARTSFWQRLKTFFNCHRICGRQ